MMCVYLFIFIVRYFLIFMFVVPGVEVVFGILSMLIFIICTILFVLVSNMNPGFVKKKEANIVDLYERYQPDYICVYCEVKKPKHVKHCQHCKRCVEYFDHHCPWIHNCVGRRNHKVFFMFLIAIETDFIYHFIMGLLDYFEIWPGDHLIEDIFEEEPLKSCGQIVGLAISLFCIIAFFVVFPLLYVQCGNIIQGTTTRSRFGHSGANEESEDSSSMFV